MKRFFVLIAFVLSLVSCSKFQAIRAVYSGEQAAVPEMSTIPFASEGHLIIVGVRLNDRPELHNFILDTGAFTVIDDDLAASLGIVPIAGTTGRDSSGASRPLDLALLDEIALGDAKVRNCGATVFDLGRVAGLASRKIEGLLGSNFLRFFRIEIDYRRGKLTLTPTGSHALTVAGPRGTEPGIDPDLSYKMGFESSPSYAFAPMLNCTLNGGRRIRMVVDTGAPNAVSFPAPFLNELREQSDGRLARSIGAAAGGAFGNSAAVYLLRLRSLEIDKLKFENVAAFSVDMEVGLLGKDFLSRFLTVIDYPANTIWFFPVMERERDFARMELPSDFSSLGIAAMPSEEEGLTVTGLWTPSPAFSGGVEIGDRILSVNGTAAGALSMMKLQQLFADPSVTNYDIVLSSPSGERTVTLRKENLLN